MALSPSIPTSFVPKQPVQSVGREPKAGWNIFWIVALILFGATAIGALGVFLYTKYLESAAEAKYNDILEAENQISKSTVQDFIRLRDRFASAIVLLDTHTVASKFFDLLESQTLETVRFSTLTFSLDDDGMPVIVMEGIAKSFNALAAQSRAFSEEKNFKRTIFSGITVNANNTVAFVVSFGLDGELLTTSVEEANAVPLPVEEPSEEEPAAEGAPEEELEEPASETGGGKVAPPPNRVPGPGQTQAP